MRTIAGEGNPAKLATRRDRQSRIAAMVKTVAPETVIEWGPPDGSDDNSVP